MDRMQQMDDNGKLDGLMVAYRQACPDPDASPEFMPRLWQRIETRRVETVSIFKRLAQVCVAATALALVLLSTVTTSVETEIAEAVADSSYTEVLAADHAERNVIDVLSGDIAAGVAR